MKKNTPTLPIRSAVGVPPAVSISHEADAERPAPVHPSTLAIDIGGTGLKASVLDSAGKMISDRVSTPTPYPCPPLVMVQALTDLVMLLPAFDRVAVGFPGQIRRHQVVTAPHFGTDIWNGFNLSKALSLKLGKPVRLLNDADMQGLGAISGEGLELVVTLGTGVGTALFRNGDLMPHLELAHHPFRNDKTYNEFLGKVALEKWAWKMEPPRAPVAGHPAKPDQPRHDLHRRRERQEGGGRTAFARPAHFQRARHPRRLPAVGTKTDRARQEWGVTGGVPRRHKD